jgi:TPP-dependent pyruvate/acetoin dehydrogenase alpha subunit
MAFLKDMTNTDQGNALELYSMMQTIRQAELRLSRLFADAEIPGFIHLSLGQEAVAAGVIAALDAQDLVASNHRGHGHAIAKGIDLVAFFQEIMAKDMGCCRGRGGSMHVADASKGMLGANGIVGAGIPIALGSALAQQVRKTGAVAVAFFGDGALAEGVIHECLNLSSLWHLPLLFVCENNGWSEFSPTFSQFRAKLPDLAAAFGIPAVTVDGNDVFAVYSAAQAAVCAARDKGPQVLQCITHRVRGHFEGDPQKYRTDMQAANTAQLDPLLRFEQQLDGLGLTKADIDAATERVLARIEAAVSSAREGAAPSFSGALADAYTSNP